MLYNVKHNFKVIAPTPIPKKKFYAFFSITGMLIKLPIYEKDLAIN